MNLMPEAISSYGPEIDALIAFISAIALPVLILAEAVLIGIVLFKRTPKDKKAPYLAGKGWRQLKWIFIPVFGVVVLDFLIDERTGAAWSAVMRELPSDGMKVKITGSQFQWTFTYAGADGLMGTADDIRRVNELTVPADSNVIFDLEAKDMLHSFWVPALRLKQDAVPGRSIRRWFRAEKTGAYGIACAELCGAGHSLMAATLKVEPKERFRAFMQDEDRKAEAAAKEAEAAERRLAAQLAAAGAEERESVMRGARLAQEKGCLGCHSTDGSRVVGPTWKGIYGRSETLSDGRTIRADDDYIVRSIREPALERQDGYPAGIMPDLHLGASEIRDLLKFLKTVK